MPPDQDLNGDSTAPSQLKTGYVDENGNSVPTTIGFHFLKDHLTFKVTSDESDLPFQLPPCTWRPVHLRLYEHLRTMPVGYLSDTVPLIREFRTPGDREVRAIFRRDSMGDLSISYVNYIGEAVAEHDIVFWDKNDDLQGVGRECLEKYEAATSAQESLFRTAQREWMDRRKEWEWQTFCLARQHHTEMIWSTSAQYDAIMAAEKSSSMLDEPRDMAPEEDRSG